MRLSTWRGRIIGGACVLAATGLPLAGSGLTLSRAWAGVCVTQVTDFGTVCVTPAAPTDDAGIPIAGAAGPAVGDAGQPSISPTLPGLNDAGQTLP